MDFVTKLFLALIYLLVFPLRLWDLLRGRDRARLKQPNNADTYWIVRAANPDSGSYFSEGSVAEGRGINGAARWITPLLRLMSRAYAPARELSFKQYSAQEREQGIPDEIYTLW